MKLIMENWRRFLVEATDVPPEQKKGFREAILASQFWKQPHTEGEVDLASDGEMSTPAIEVLMDALNAKAEELGTDLYFLLTVTDDEQYTLGPDDQFGGYPNNWMMRGQYRGPEKGKHIVWLEFRPISEEFNMDDFDPNELAKKISTTLNHELVHYNQLKKQAASKGISEEEAFEEMLADPKQMDQTGTRGGYLSRHNEVDAFAHEAAEELLDKYSPEEALDLIKRKDSKLGGVVGDYEQALGDKPEEMKKFWKKLYTQIMAQASEKK